MIPGTNPYAGVSQSTDLRVISSLIDPKYRAKNDTYQLNVDYQVTPNLKVTSQTAYNTDSLYSTQDFNRYNTAPGIFQELSFSSHLCLEDSAGPKADVGETFLRSLLRAIGRVRAGPGLRPQAHRQLNFATIL